MSVVGSVQNGDVKMKARVVVVTVCRNEEKNIKKAIASVLSQTFPLTYFVVDDGSTDKTFLIASSFKKVRVLRLPDCGWKDIGMRLARALNTVLPHINRTVPTWEFLIKVDADSSLPPNFVSRLVQKMLENPKLGIASGVPIGSKMDPTHACDGARIYRRTCLEQIGKFYPVYGYDTHTLFEAKRMGWQVTNFPDITYIEQRPWGAHTNKWWITRGVSRYKLGFPFIHTILASLKRAITQKPRILGGLILILTYLISHLAYYRPFSKQYYTFVGNYMKNELYKKLSRVVKQCLLI